MASSFLIPIITWLPPDYDCTIVMPPAALVDLMIDRTGQIERYWQIVAGGQTVHAGTDKIEYRNGTLTGPPPPNVIWRGSDYASWPDAGGYVEFGIRSANGAPLFRGRRLPSFYNLYTANGRKSFFTCHTWKFGSPQVISQIARFGRYVDAYSVIHIDRARDLGDSLVLVNPYAKPILAQLMTQDGRRPPRHRIPAHCAVRLDLASLIAPDEAEWIGQIQLTANNRLVTYIVKHSLADPTSINTVEHLDPYRADRTHLPWFRWLRVRYGDYVTERRAARK